jgi:hypothetical protein
MELQRFVHDEHEVVVGGAAQSFTIACENASP